MIDFYESRMDAVKQFIFNIEDAQFSVLTDKAIEYATENDPKSSHGQLHFHVYYEIFHINKGKVAIVFEDGKREFEKDDFVVVTPGTNHKSLTVEPGTSRYNINFLMEKNMAKTDFSMYDALKNILVNEFVCVKESSDLRDLLNKVVLDIMQGNGALLSLHFHELMLRFLEKQGYPQKKNEVKRAISDSSMIRMYKLQQIIFTSYSQDISLDYIAEKLYLSTRQTSRIIKRYYGCTYRELVAKTRMKLAAELLEETEMSILEIAAQTGYTSIKGFYSYFKKEFNCLPTEYRKKTH